MEKELDIFGLTRLESKIYISLLELGPSLANIISRKSGIHRRSVYDAIERLIEKGLVSYLIKNNRRYFEAVNPQRLNELLKEKQEKAEKIIPELEIKFNSVKEKQETLFFKGKNGLKTVFEDQLQTAKEILVIGASPMAKELLFYYFNWYDKRRIKKRINLKLIYDESGRKKRNIKLAEIRYLPFNSSPAAINIYDNNVAIILWKKERPMVVLIRDSEIAKSYKSYFKYIWSLAKK